MEDTVHRHGEGIVGWDSRSQWWEAPEPEVLHVLQDHGEHRQANQKQIPAMAITPSDLFSNHAPKPNVLQSLGTAPPTGNPDTGGCGGGAFEIQTVTITQAGLEFTLLLPGAPGIRGLRLHTQREQWAGRCAIAGIHTVKQRVMCSFFLTLALSQAQRLP